MSELQESRLPKALPVGASPFLDLITAAQHKIGWKDEVLELRLGFCHPNLMTLVRHGLLQLSYRTALNMGHYLDVSAPDMLQAFVRSQANMTDRAVQEMSHHLKEQDNFGHVVDAYDAVVSGDNRVRAFKLPRAAIWVVPDAAMKIEGVTDYRH